MRRLGVVVAMKGEAAPSLAEPSLAFEEAGEGLWISHVLPLRLQVSGIGKVFASWALSRIAADSDLVLSLGLSGALPTGKAGSGSWLVREFVEHDMEVSGLRFEPGVTPYAGMDGPVIRCAGDDELALARAAAAAAGLPCREGRAASGDRFIDDAALALALARRTGADIVDMECAAIAKLCALRARSSDGRPLPMFAFRAVSDAADGEASRSFEENLAIQARALAAFLREFAPRYCGPASS